MRKNSNYLFYFYKYFYLWYFHIFLFLCILKCYLFLRRKAEFSSIIRLLQSSGTINPSNMLIHCSRNVLDFMLSVYKCKMFLESCTQNVLFTNLVNILFWDKGFYSKFKPVSHSATLSQSKLPVPDGELKRQWLVFDVETQNVSNCHESDHCKKHLLPLHSCISRRGIKGKWFLS